jgi:iron complex outermembrane receptor protein
LNTTGSPLSHTLDSIYGANNGPAGPGFFPGGVAGYAQWSRAHPYDIFLQYDLPHRATNTFVSNTTQVELGADMTLKNIFSFMQGDALTPGNLAGGPFGSLWLFNSPNNATGLSGTPPGGEQFHSTTYSDEVQLQGKLDGGRLQYTAGAFYSNQHRYEIIPINIGSDLGLPTPIADIDYAYRNTETSTAIYAQVSYNFTDKLTATLGGRYTWESVGISQADGSVFTLGGPVAPESKNLSAPAWTFNLQYQVDPHNMVYFSQRGSFRSGNFNGTVSPFNNPATDTPSNFFKNEYVHDFELGYKFNGYVANAPVQFNVAAYDVIVTNAQHALYAIVDGNPAGFTVNVPEAVTRGVEADGAIGLTSWLDLDVNLAYTHAQYTRGLVPIPGGSPLTVDSYPDTPLWSGSVGADVKFPVAENLGKMDLRVDFYAQSHTFFSSTNGSVTPDTGLNGYDTIGLRYNWKDIRQSRVSAALYVRNLADKLYYVSGYALGASAGLNTAYPGEPRTFGAELSVKF